MLRRWAMAFLIIALVAGIFAWVGGMPVAAEGIAKTLFLGFLFLFLVAFLRPLQGLRDHPNRGRSVSTMSTE